jgi:lactate dehydrogenase-like 2-hydroxyacid dehydrogenase
VFEGDHTAGHQVFFTEEALGNIAQTTIQNIKAFADKQELLSTVKI